jgi:hypothetical protein
MPRDFFDPTPEQQNIVLIDAPNSSEGAPHDRRVGSL